MKHFLLALSLFFCLSAFAEEAAPTASIGTRYVVDTLLVPVRTGQSEAYRIIHRGIRSGSKVELLESNAESGYSRIRLSGGLEGWVQSHYLQATPTAEQRLADAHKTIERLKQVSGSSGAQLLELEANNNALSRDLNATEQALKTLQSEFTQLQSISTNAVQLNEDYQRLLTQTQELKNQRDTLQADNHRLNEELSRRDFINGALAILLGMLATLAIQYLKNSRKRSDWA